MPPRRKPLLDLEAELQGDADAQQRPSQSSSSRSVVQTERQHEESRSTHNANEDSAASKRKEFAWMDSDDDESDKDNDKTAHSTEKKRKRSTSRSASRSRSSSPALPVPEIQTFSQMVRAVDGIKARIPSMSPTELVECLAAVARVKFYDEFLQDKLIPRIRKTLGDVRKKSPFSTEELVTVLCSLSDLNCFDKALFARIVRELADKRSMELLGPDRSRLISAFKSVKYECEEDTKFYDWLRSVEKAHRYEAACAEQRMIVGNSKQGMHAPEGYLRSFMVGTTSSGVEVKRPQSMVS